MQSVRAKLEAGGDQKKHIWTKSLRSDVFIRLQSSAPAATVAEKGKTTLHTKKSRFRKHNTRIFKPKLLSLMYKFVSDDDCFESRTFPAHKKYFLIVLVTEDIHIFVQ